MRVKVHRIVHKFMEQEFLDYEVTVEWILGYVRGGNARNVFAERLISVDLTDYVEVDIPKHVIHSMQRCLPSGGDLDQAVNTLLITAYLLGGSE